MILPPTRADLLPETRKFLREWLEWAENGAPECLVFRRHSGLCPVASWYDDRNNTSTRKDLERAFEHRSYPFGGAQYGKRCVSRTQHLDPNRLAWVRANV